MTDLLDIRPALRSDVQMRPAEDGRTLAVGPSERAYLWMRDDDLRVVALLDGRSAIPAIYRHALALDPPIAPDRVLDTVLRLGRAGMLRDGVDERTQLFEAVGTRPTRRIAWMHPALARCVAPMRHLPAGLWAPASTAALAACVAVVAIAAARGRSYALLSPLGGSQSTLVALGTLYLGAVLALSARAVARAAVLRAYGHAVPAGGVQLTAGIAHLAFDTRERRAAPRAARLALALGGLGAIAGVAGAAGGVALTCSSDAAGTICATAIALLLVDLAPYLRTDVRDLLGIVTRVRGVGRGVLGYVAQGAGHAAVRAARAEERALIVAATLAVVQSLGLLALWIGFVVPDAVQRALDALLPSTLTGMAAGERALAVGVGVVTAVAVVALWGGLAILAARAVWSLVGPRPRPTPRAPAPAEPHDRVAFEGSRAARALLADLDHAQRSALIEGIEVVEYRAGDRIAAGGRPTPWFGVVLDGTARVRDRDVSGALLDGAALGVGDFMGAHVLAPTAHRPWEIVAAAPVRLAVVRPPALERALSAAARAALVDRTELVLDLQRLPLASGLASSRFAELVDGATSVGVARGTALRGAPLAGSALWVVRSGVVAVHAAQQSPSAPGRTLGAGSAFGAFVDGDADIDRIEAIEDASLVRLEASAVRAMLLANLDAPVLWERRSRQTLAVPTVDRGGA